MSGPAPLDDEEAMTEALEDLLVSYDTEATIFGTTGAGAFFLAEYLVRHGVTLGGQEEKERDDA